MITTEKIWQLRRRIKIKINHLALGPALIGTLISTGCIHISRPAVPDSLSQSADTKYSAKAFHDDYNSYKGQVSAGNISGATATRDQMIGRVEVDIEQDYRRFEGTLFGTRAAAQTVGDVVELGISAATGVASGTDVKDLLSASLTGFKGTRLSVDKNYFQEKTTEALISQMQAYRDSVRTRITQNMTELDASKYPFEQAWRDLVELFYAGTLQAALQQLANQSGQAATQAKSQLNNAEIKQAISAEQEKSAVRIRSKYAELYNAANGSDQAKKDAAIKAAKDALIALGQGDKITPSTTGDQIFEMLREQMRQALENPEDIQSMDKILGPPAK